MKTSLVTDSQIIAILKQAEAGSPVPELWREHGVSNATFYKWRQVRRHGRVVDGTHEGVGRRKSTPEEDVCEERLKAEIVPRR